MNLKEKLCLKSSACQSTLEFSSACVTAHVTQASAGVSAKWKNQIAAAGELNIRNISQTT